jgi:MtN3 and saliva related transmembrane protein
MSIDVDAIGFLAGLLTTVAFAPQLIRTWRMGGHELSWTMLILFGTGVSLWLYYGMVTASAPLMVANGVTLVQVMGMAAIKFRSRARH